MYIAIDIGGTKTLVASLDENGQIINRAKFPTDHDFELFKTHLREAVSKLNISEPKAITIAVPCPVQNIYSLSFANLPWRNIDLITPIKNLYGTCPIYILNDASLAAYYEAAEYSGRSFYFTFSTGIGGGIVEDGQLAPESNTFEPGHIRYIFNDKELEWEHFASAKAFGADYHCVATDVQGEAGMRDLANRISIGLLDNIQKYHPDTIIIGGPLGDRFDDFYPFLDPTIKSTHIIKAKYPQECVIHGCFLYARNHESN